ncbi:hypothetical protein VE04_08987 [Pseudogymnoascus sp. 24MN13]|nr:hypothetical protein VE04_08987 [Pseudogymnoascus sp. 24MN13]
MRSSTSASAKAPPPLLTGAAKLAEVKRLLEKLSLDLQKICMLPHREQDVEVDVDSTRLTDIERAAAVAQLKLYGRDPVDAEPIFTQEGIETLTRHAFNSPSFTTSRNALRCLANALPPGLRLSNDNREDEFLVSRIIFLTTYGGNMDLENLIDNHHLAENINQNISRHAKQYDEVLKMEKKESDRSSASSMSTKDREKREKKERKAKEKEMKKNAKNPESTEPDPVPKTCPWPKPSSSSSTPPTSAARAPPPSSPPSPPSCASSSSAPSPHQPHGAPHRPTNQRPHQPRPRPRRVPPLPPLRPKDPRPSTSSTSSTLPQPATQSATSRSRSHAPSPSFAENDVVAPRPVKVHLRMLLLPTAEDRLKPLGATNTLSSRILKLSTSPLAPTAREELSHLLFEMSDKDAKNFVQNVGYGFASGFLFQNNVPIPENALDAWSINDSASMAVNPITGQTLDSEEPWEGPKMTREEKEREAERLMVMFDRLQKNGIIKTENPMRTMQHEGRFEELSDDDSS